MELSNARKTHAVVQLCSLSNEKVSEMNKIHNLGNGQVYSENRCPSPGLESSKTDACNSLVLLAAGFSLTVVSISSQK